MQAADAAAAFNPDAVAADVSAAIAAVHAPGVGPASLQAARELHERLCRQFGVHKVVFRLTEARFPPEVQHFGIQVLVAALRSKPPVLAAHERLEVRAWLVSLFAVDRWSAGASAPYVRAKLCELIAEVARLDWPTEWPELKPALLQMSVGVSPGAAALALGAWCHIADLLVEDSKDLTATRKKELAAALNELVEQPQAAPELMGALQQALQRHGCDMAVVREALGLCRALANSVPMRVLLHHSADQIVRIGVEVEELRSLAMSALAEWVERLFPKGKVKEHMCPAKHDLCRFVSSLASLAQRCVFDGDQQVYAFHQRVADLVSDLCVGNAENLARFLPTSDLRALWSAVFHLLRYPSISVQISAASAMSALARASPNQWNNSARSPPRPPLEELVGVTLVHIIKTELLDRLIDQDRSSWLLRCLGRTACAKAPGTYQAWQDMLAQTQAFDLRDTDRDCEERLSLYSPLKTRLINTIISVTCRAEVLVDASEGYNGLCRYIASLVARALGATGGAMCIAEFDAALSIVERAGQQALRVAEGSGDKVDLVVKSSFALLQQVSSPSATFSARLELRRLEFLSRWSPFYRHCSADVVGSVLQRLMSYVEKPPEQATPLEAKELSRRACETLIGLGKNGGLRPEHLQVMRSECERLSPTLNLAAGGKLIEALGAATASCSTMDAAQRSDLICGLLENPTRRWLAPALGEVFANPDRLLGLFAAIAASPQLDQGRADPDLQVVNEIKLLLGVFVGVTAKCGSAGSAGVDAAGDAEMEDDVVRPAPSAPRLHLVGSAVKAWAPRIFALAISLAGTCAAANSSMQPSVQVVFGNLAKVEQDHVLGYFSDSYTELVPEGFVITHVRTARASLWGLRGNIIAAVRACVMCPDFWALPEACAWLHALAKQLPSQRLHIACCTIKDVFLPLCGKPTSGFEDVPAPLRPQLCRTVVPRLIESIRSLLHRCWSPHVSAGLMPSDVHERVAAASAQQVTRVCARLLASMVGHPAVAKLAHPEKQLFTRGPRPVAPPPAPPAKRRKKDRSKNSFAALAEDAEEMDAPAPQAAEPEEPDAPQGAAAYIMADAEAREALRSCLAEVCLRVPDPEAMAVCLKAIQLWAAHLWNRIARGDESPAVQGAPAGRCTDPGELLHAASTALRILGDGVVRPLCDLVSQPPAVASICGIGSGVGTASTARPNPFPVEEKTSALRLAPSNALSNLVEQSWGSYIAATTVQGNTGPSALVSEVAQTFHTALTIMVRLFRIQCRKVDVQFSLDAIYLSPMLTTTQKCLCDLPRTSVHDVRTLLETTMEHDTSEACRGALRTLLHQASPVGTA